MNYFKKMVDEKANSIELKADSNRLFFLIHGYTGSPTDFNGLPKLLNENFNANIKVILLKGHGTEVKDLDDITYADFLHQIKHELEKDIKCGKEIILGGISLGAHFALTLASQYPIKGVFSVCIPYNIKFPFNIIGLENIGVFKKYWKKVRGQEKEEKIEEEFSYDYMHINGLSILKQANIELEKNIGKLKCPILSIHSYEDPIGSYKSLKFLQKNVKSIIREEKILKTKIHNVFFCMNNNETYEIIMNFIKNNNLFNRKDENKVAAVIPTFNEGKRILDVLNIVTNSKILDEIIVVDDGSTDNTEEILKNFKNIKYLKNKHNIGKAGSMDRGVLSTDADIIFFCDADLIGLNQGIISEIIKPVLEGNFNMSIGLRENIMQSSVHLFAINSGERAIRRVVWENLPKYFKYKYRVEAGLNYYVKYYFGGFFYKTFNYSQPIKEKKYGFLEGTLLRWAMNIDVSYVYIRDFFTRLNK